MDEACARRALSLKFDRGPTTSILYASLRPLPMLPCHAENPRDDDPMSDLRLTLQR